MSFATEPKDGLPFVHLTQASTITPRPVKWLWLNRVALFAFSLIGGREGVGKSSPSYTVAAAITKGTLDGDYYGTPKNVIVGATEDSWAHTIVPRLMGAWRGSQAHLSRRCRDAGWLADRIVPAARYSCTRGTSPRFAGRVDFSRSADVSSQRSSRHAQGRRDAASPRASTQPGR